MASPEKSSELLAPGVPCRAPAPQGPSATEPGSVFSPDKAKICLS